MLDEIYDLVMSNKGFEIHEIACAVGIGGYKLFWNIKDLSSN